MDNRSKNKARVSAVARCGYVAFILLAVGFLLYFLLCSLTLNMQFRAMVRDADHVIIRDGGGLCHSDPDSEPSLYEITNKAEIAEFNQMFRFSSQTMRCRCCGYPGVDWWRNGKRIAVSAIHHGTALRIEGKSFDWHLSPRSQERIKEWLEAHCKERSKTGYPMYRQCFENRGYLEMEAWDWAKTNSGRKPNISDLRDSAKKKWSGERELSCPAGGEYSLSFDENGDPHVSCTIPRHD